MTDTLKALLAELRQHPAFQELLKVVEPPSLPRYRPSKGFDVPAMGARAIFASGQIDQHERWLSTLTGVSTVKGGE